MSYITINKNKFLAALCAATGASASEAENMFQQLQSEGDVCYSNRLSPTGGNVMLLGDAVIAMWSR
ncbi:hypothetical protein IFR05_017651, partial [Cadophora sp. M221]